MKDVFGYDFFCYTRYHMNTPQRLTYIPCMFLDGAWNMALARKP